ncbi:mitochondrial E3 ubiquitin protein ligase 1-like isoform X3 [Mytilus galloprovincialis]|uniref:mitochondrial E3 ubiquitin protein ligase 1-like isoform X3 n=1 Tax=Mytilus galloprovincialis TaxID=29158 RepID=UPI003F7BFB64
MGSNAQILKLYLSKYKDADLAKQDILAVFSQYKDLRPSHGPFIFNDGSRKDLVNLDGTIPIHYRDAGHRSCTSATDRRLLCTECSLNPLEVTIQPCGHLATCESCCRRLKKQHNQCPICNGPIDNVVRSFVPE